MGLFAGTRLFKKDRIEARGSAKRQGLRRWSQRAALAGALAATAFGAAVQARSYTKDEAEALRELDIMLMVTSLRCRTSADDFQADYRRFTARHLATLSAAARQLTSDFERRQGKRAARRALDRYSTTLANRYGTGHPRLGCAQLRALTRDLAASSGDAPLLEASRRYLLNARPERLSLAP